MLQDLRYGAMDNHYTPCTPEAADTVLCFSGDDILLCRTQEDALILPRYSQVQSWAQQQGWEAGTDGGYRYLFCLQENRYFLRTGKAGACPDETFRYEAPRRLRQSTSRDVCFGILTGWHLYRWYDANRFCGRCATPTVHDSRERMLFCPNCGNQIFPKIAPAVIIALTDGDRILLSKYAGRSYTRYALLAGFTEIGETLEQTVAREVMEEVGLHVKNIRYYKSQPWGIDSNVLMGFYCDLDGDDTIRLDTQELALAQWHRRGAIPAKDDGFSLTREMIRVFDENRHPMGNPG